MIDFSLEHTLRPLDFEIARTTKPRHLAILRNLREHLLAELAGDVDAIMKTQCAEPQYHFYGAGNGDFGPKGGAAVREFCEHIFALGYNKLRYVADRFVVDDRTLFHEGQLSGNYVFSYRQAAVFHYDEHGVCTGEDTYSDGPLTSERLRKLTPAEEATLPRGR